MSDEEFRKYVELLLSMSTNYLMGGLSRAAYENNLHMITDNMLPPSDQGKGAGGTVKTEVYEDDLDAQKAAFNYIAEEWEKYAHLPGREVRHEPHHPADGCTSSLWANGQLRAIAVRLRNDFNRTVLVLHPQKGPRDE